MIAGRRQLLKALGLGALASLIEPLERARAQTKQAPQRIVFFVQPHGHVPRSWLMPMANGASDAFAERTLVGLKQTDFSNVLAPLFDYRDRLLVIEGLSHTTIASEVVAAQKNKTDPNNHNVAVAGLLTCNPVLQRPGVVCTGGAESLDQLLARRMRGPGRFASRVYGHDYIPNQVVAPFSFLGSGEPTPVVTDAATAFSDLMGLAATPDPQPQATRADKLRMLRGSVLDSVAQEYETLAPRLDNAGRQKLEAHRQLVRDLELSLATVAPAQCSLKFDATGDSITPFMRIIRMALACDLTRVVTYVAPVPNCEDFGYPKEAHVHSTYAHASVQGDTSCGQMYSELAEHAMTDLSIYYAKHFAALLAELDAVPEGSGTLLDNTLVVWLTELGTPTHEHHDVFSLVAGGTSFRMGRYVRYPRTLQNPLADKPLTGPAQSRLFVSLLQALGQKDDTFGLPQVSAADGSTVSLRGPLREL